MTNEEKAKAYDEALERAKKELNTCGSMDCDAARQIFRFFPQLRESEDERMINELQGFLSSYGADYFGTGEWQKFDAWLEKQKEQKPVEKEITLTSFEGTLNTFLFDFANSPIEDCEPKEYIKKHSAEILKAAYKELNAKLQQDIFEARQEGIRDGYEVAKAEQKPAEWSNKDEEMMTEIIEFLEYAYPYDNEFRIAWLKSLRGRPKSSDNWKPSEEQMKALQNAVALAAGNKVLAGLYEQLKSL